MTKSRRPYQNYSLYKSLPKIRSSLRKADLFSGIFCFININSAVFALFHGYGFCKVAGFINIAAVGLCNVICKNLQGNNF